MGDQFFSPSFPSLFRFRCLFGMQLKTLDHWEVEIESELAVLLQMMVWKIKEWFRVTHNLYKRNILFL